MKWLAAGLAGLSLWGGTALAGPREIDVVYTADVRGTVGICG